MSFLGILLVGPKLHKGSVRGHLPVITCSCGYEILILPDLKIMSQVIEEHVLDHKNKGVTDSEADVIELDLIAQIFSKIAE